MSYSRLSTPLPGARPTQPSRDTDTSSIMSRFSNSFKPTHPSAKGVLTPERRKRLLVSYAPDWALTIVLAAGFFLLDKVEGYRRVFSLEDTSLRHPYAVHERIPNLWLMLIAIVAPLCIMPIVNFITVRSWWDLHNSSLGLILGAALTGAFTQVVKITVGRPRPDIIDRCQPPSGTVDPTYGLTNWTVCTQPDAHILRDGFRSFFSGHSSLSFAGLGFLSFYLAGKLHLFDSRGHAGKAWLALSPFMAAALVAISRSMDYRHHWQDILVGSLVGTLFSYFSYRQYYPALESPLSHRPYSPRIKREEEEMGTGGVLPMHHHGQQQYGGQYKGAHQSGYTSTPGGQGGVNAHRRFDSNASYGPYEDSVVDLPIRGGGDTYEMAMAGGRDGTVPRPRPGSLDEVWRDGSEEDHDQYRTRGYGGPQTSTCVRSIPGPTSRGFGSVSGHSTAPPDVGQMATYPPSTIPSEPPSAVDLGGKRPSGGAPPRQPVLQVPEPAVGYTDPFSEGASTGKGAGGSGTHNELV